MRINQHNGVVVRCSDIYNNSRMIMMHPNEKKNKKNNEKTIKLLCIEERRRVSGAERIFMFCFVWEGGGTHLLRIRWDEGGPTM